MACSSSERLRLTSSFLGPLFDPWVPPPSLFEALAPPEDPDFQEDLTPFVMLTKRGRVIWSYLGVYVYVFMLIYTLLFWT